MNAHAYEHAYSKNVIKTNEIKEAWKVILKGLS